MVKLKLGSYLLEELERIAVIISEFCLPNLDLEEYWVALAVASKLAGLVSPLKLSSTITLYLLIRQNVHVDAVNHKVNVTYPVIGDLSKFEDNRWQVEAIAVKLEKSLAKSGRGEVYCKQYKVYRDKDFHEELSEKELKEYVE